MGYSITLDRNESRSKIKKIKFADLPRGGQFALGDPERLVTEADLELYVTFNYAWYYYSTIDSNDGIKCINGAKAKDVIPLLKTALPKLDKMIETERQTGVVLSETWGKGSKYDENDDNYWSVSAKNAKISLEKIIALGNIAPNFTFRVFA